MQRRLRDLLISLGALALVVAVVLSLDERAADVVRNTAAPGELATLSAHARSAVHAVATAFMTSDMAHLSLVLFGLAASVLVLFMLRT